MSGREENASRENKEIRIIIQRNTNQTFRLLNKYRVLMEENE